MAIVRLNPFSRPVFRSFFDDDLVDWPTYTMTDGLDVYEEENNVIVKAAVPGVKEDNIEVTYEDGVLHINAKEEQKEQEKKKNRIVHQMKRVSSFNYSTTLPRAIDASKISAEVDNGVIMVKAPVAEAAKARKIQVKKISKK